MTPEIISTLLQASGAAGVTLMFVVYLVKRDKRDSEMMERFNATVNGHLKDANKVQMSLAVKLNELNETNKELKESNKELKESNTELIDIVHKTYIQNLELVKNERRLRAQSAGQG